jgi:hypothetical protein
VNFTGQRTRTIKDSRGRYGTLRAMREEGGQVATELQRDSAGQGKGVRSVSDIMGVEYNGR